MNFQDAEKEIRELVSDAALISLNYQKKIHQHSMVERECTAIIVWRRLSITDLNCESFRSTNWGGVIKKIKIYLVPNDAPSDEGEPKEDVE
jgi:hypothetical protein